MKFANPEYLYLLILVPLFVAVYIISNHRRMKRLKEYGDATLLKELMPDLSAYRPTVKFTLSMVAMALMTVVLARPQFGSKMETVTRQGIETVIALDISNSMLAEDIAPNRLEKSKKIISRLIDKFENDKVGLIVFAGDAFVQLPITNDFVSAKMFMETISPSLISRQGTDIGAAINLAMKSFTPNKEVGKAVIVITDGENHEGGAEEAAKAAVESGISIYMLGVGSTDGAPIPDVSSGDYRLPSFRQQLSACATVKGIFSHCPESPFTSVLFGGGAFLRAAQVCETSHRRVLINTAPLLSLFNWLNTITISQKCQWVFWQFFQKFYRSSVSAS